MCKTSQLTRRTLRSSISSVIEPLENRQLLSAGQLDSTFGTGGLANTGWAKDLGESLVLPSGKILVAGTVTATYKDADGKDYTSDSVSVARYNSNGTLDSTFGNGGVSPALNSPNDLSGSSYDIGLFPRDLAIQSDGKIVVALGVESP